MRYRYDPRRRSEPGQVLVIVAGGLLALIAMVGLVIDGGYAWGQQRETQNGADATAKAGAGVIQQYLADSTNAAYNGGAVGCAVEGAADGNAVDLLAAEYTDFEGNTIGTAVPACGDASAIPTGAQGVKATTEQEFDTFLVGVIGFDQMTAQADATAVVGRQVAICPAADGCGILPVTFPRSLDTCDGTNHRVVGEDDWELLDPDVDSLDVSNLSLLPLCVTGPGSVGWIDFGCAPNLASMIDDPCNTSIPIPAWLQTKPGNTNSLEDNLEPYTGPTPTVAEDADAVVYIPIHDWTCDQDLPDSAPKDACPGYINGTAPDEWTGTGSGLHYHIPYWAGFKIDGAYTGGNDPECNNGLGSPQAAGNGATGCLKGWFVNIIMSPGSVSTGVITPGDPVGTGVLLIQ
jgi:hypothetical protein